jgi:predicted ATPase/DNA-binding SARP family transcriptional activator
LGGPKQQSVLAVLIVRAGQAVSRDDLIDEVWSERAPEGVRNTLQAYASRLRQALGPDSITNVGHGYRLNVANGGVDAEQFRSIAGEGGRALARGDAGTAIDLLGSGLALWRGDAYAELQPSTVRAEAHRLAEERLVALESLVEARLQLGDETVLPELQRLVREHPHRERLHGELMVALYRAGRQVEALDVFTQLRARLVDERGIEPGAEIRMLQRRMLQQDPGLLHQAAPSMRPRPFIPHVSTFVGRERELDDVRDRCRTRRIVTLTGPAGCGKTRLALEAARAWARGDGAALVEFSPVTEPGRVTDGVAAALGIRLSGEADPTALIAAHVGARGMVIVLDGCEHVRESVAPLAAELVRRCKNVRILATSRVPLAAGDEEVVRLRPLELPAAGAAQPLDQVLESPSARLLADRLADAAPGVVLRDEDAGRIVELVTMLEGLPLAIELAADRISGTTLAELTDSLRGQVIALRADRRVADPRERSLRAAIAWSHRLLDPAQRSLFDRLSVFAGRFDVHTASAICGDSPLPGATVEGLRDLAAFSMIFEDGDGYRLLDSLREFAAEQLLSGGEHDRFRRRHAAYYRGFAAEARLGMLGARHAEWVARLDRAFPDIRRAVAWAAENDAPLAAGIVGELQRYVMSIGADDQWVEWLERLAGSDLPDEARSRVLTACGWAALGRGDLDEAEQRCVMAVGCAHRAGTARAISTQALASTFFYARADERCEAEFMRAAEWARVERDGWVLLQALNGLGCVQVMQNPSAARATWRDALRVADELGDPESALYPQGNLGWLAFDEGDAEQAAALLRPVVASIEALGNVLMTANGRTDLAYVELALGRGPEAAALWLQALTVAVPAGSVEIAGRALDGLGCFLAAGGRPAGAAAYWGAADRLKRQLSDEPSWAELATTRAFPPHIRPHRDPGFSGEWEAGAAWTLEQALAAARLDCSPR